MFILSSKGLVFWSVNHSLIYKYSELHVFKDQVFGWSI